jgi:hypothetical protein
MRMLYRRRDRITRTALIRISEAPSRPAVAALSGGGRSGMVVAQGKEHRDAALRRTNSFRTSPEAFCPRRPAPFSYRHPLATCYNRIQAEAPEAPFPPQPDAKPTGLI